MNIVGRGNGNILRHGIAHFVQAENCLEGNDIAVTKNCRIIVFFAENFFYNFFGIADFCGNIFYVFLVKGNAALAKSLFIAAEPCLRTEYVHKRVQEQNSAVPLFDQMLRREVTAHFVVHDNGIGLDIVKNTSEQYIRKIHFVHDIDTLRIQLVGKQQNAVHIFLHGFHDGIVLVLGNFICRHEKNAVALRSRIFLCVFGEQRKVRIAKIGQDDGQRIGVAGPHTACKQIGNITELLSLAFDFFAQLFGNRIAVLQSTRNRCDRAAAYLC